MDKKQLDKLSDEHLKLVEVVRDEWLERAFCGDPSIDEARLNEGIEFIYSLGNYKRPEIIIVDSPHAAQLKANELDGNKEGSYRWYSFSGYVNYADYGWVAFYDFWTRAGYLKDDNFNRYRELMMSGLYDTIQFETHCIVVRRPTLLARDRAKRLHCVNGPAAQFNDKSSYYFYHGIAVEKWMVETPDKITLDNILNESNQEMKRIKLELFGHDRFLRETGAKPVDVRHTAPAGKLYVIDMGRGQIPIKYLEVLNSTMEPHCNPSDPVFKKYLLRVHPDCKDVQEALASTFPDLARFSKQMYHPIYES